nr:hypothetical protein [Chitinophagaceae bacterium]
AYYNGLDEDKQGALSYENDMVIRSLQQLQQMELYFKSPQAQITTPETGKPMINNPPVKKDTQVHDKIQ